MSQLNLAEQEKKDLADFLNSLTGDLTSMALPRLP